MSNTDTNNPNPTATATPADAELMAQLQTQVDLTARSLARVLDMTGVNPAVQLLAVEALYLSTAVALELNMPPSAQEGAAERVVEESIQRIQTLRGALKEMATKLKAERASASRAEARRNVLIMGREGMA